MIILHGLRIFLDETYGVIIDRLEVMPPFGTPKLEDTPLSTPTYMWNELEDHRALKIPHHTANEVHYLRPVLFDNPEFASVVEIFQDIRGTCEVHEGPGVTRYADVDDPRCYVQSQLADGVKLGFIGGDHFGLALGGVWVEELTREAIYEGLCVRRSFATTGTTLTLSTSIGYVSMGRTLEDSANNHRVYPRIRFENGEVSWGARSGSPTPKRTVCTIG
ncbi:DUF3604 domain-containing protein [Haloarcula marina]|uniref:DUF3604 domain-containing protein n=1 Tax=Haloarcula marina TaxID=2961574 RepID=UPI0020B83161|nr:DUF3604 domain-containing protein [Halomicroarcula marina]